MPKMVKLILLAVLCLAALGGGLVAAFGLGPTMALVGLGGGEPEAHADAKDDGGKEKADEKDAKKAKGDDFADAKDGDAKDGAGKDGAVPGSGAQAVMPFQEIIVNVTEVLPTGRATTRFLKLHLALVYDEAIEGAPRIPERQLYMRDAFQDYLRQLNVQDLQGSYAMATVKNELLRRARAISGSEAAREMLIADLVIQ